MWQTLFEPKHLKWRWSFCICLGVYLYLFVTFCDPFKGDNITYLWSTVDAYTLHSLFNFMLSVFSCALTLIFLPYRFPNYFSSENITIKRFGSSVVITTLFIEIGYFIGNQLFFRHDLSLIWFLTFMFKVTCTSFLFIGVPSLILFFLVFNYYISPKKQELVVKIPPLENSKPSDLEEKIIELTDTTPPQYEQEEPSITLHFNDISNKKRLNVPLESLYYITSAQNYIEIFYKNQSGKLSRQLLRNTLKTVEEELLSDAKLPLVRCHKGFIVNYDKVLEMHGNAKNAYFILMDVDTQIPVSRHKFADFQGKTHFIGQLY
jgi:LytTr DNA-binding domain